MSVYENGTWAAEPDCTPTAGQNELVGFLHDCIEKGIKTVEDVRCAFASFSSMV